MNITRLVRNPRLCRAVSGMNYEEFSVLVPVFQKAVYELQMQKPDRKRNPGAGQKGKLKTAAEKLLFVLMYLKTYPTYDVLTYMTDRDRGRSCESVHFLLKALEKTLNKKLVLPKRKITSVKEFMEKFPEVSDVLLDDMERRVQKPRNLKNRLYSGKRKATTRKNVVMTTNKKKILLLSPTKSGRRHDKRLADKISLVEHIPEHATIIADTGFQGIQTKHPNSLLPMKATKNKPLTKAQKEENRLIASFRVVAEHAIAGLKRLRAASDVYRNRKPNLDDTFMFLSAGLWNFHLQQTQ